MDSWGHAQEIQLRETDVSKGSPSGQDDDHMTTMEHLDDHIAGEEDNGTTQDHHDDHHPDEPARESGQGQQLLPHAGPSHTSRGPYQCMPCRMYPLHYSNDHH